MCLMRCRNRWRDRANEFVTDESVGRANIEQIWRRVVITFLWRMAQCARWLLSAGRQPIIWRDFEPGERFLATGRWFCATIMNT